MDGAELATERHVSRVVGRSDEECREQPEGALGIALPAGFRTAAPSVLPKCEGAGKPVLVEASIQADVAGRFDEQVQRAVGWFAGFGRLESYRGLIREERPLLPRAAIREALINAIVHRDYAITGSKVLFEVFSRRVHVTSPGTLPNHTRVDGVLAGAHPRSRKNPRPTSCSRWLHGTTGGP